jgi:hypothetical protein
MAKAPEPEAWSRTPAGEPLSRSARENWRRLLTHVEEWMKDDTGYDERVWPELLHAISEDRMSYRSRG